MEEEIFDMKEFDEWRNNPTESFKRYKLLVKENNLLLQKNNKNEAIIRQMMKEQIYFIDKKIYESYDSSQSNTEEMKEETDETKSAEMFKKFKECINTIDIKSDNIGSKENHDDDNDNNNDRTFLDKKEINDIIKHEFGKNLEINEFIDAFGKAITNNINKNWIKNDRIAFKNFLENIIDTSINEIFYKKIPRHIRQLRMDNLLCTVLTKVYKPSAKRIDYLMIQASLNYSLNPLENGISFKEPETGRDLIFDKNYIKFQINNNVGILNSYYKLIQKFVTNKFDKRQLRKKLNEIIDNTNIYFCDLPKKVLGITICNGDIFISGKYLQEALHYSPNNKNYNITAISKIFLTLLHELAHKLQYILRMNYNKSGDNYFIKTFYYKDETDLDFEMIETIILDKEAVNYTIDKIYKLNETEIKQIIEYKNLHGNLTRCESGDFFDKEIYLGKEQKSVSKSISKFFLFFACKNYNDYVSIMKSFLDKVDTPEERTTNCNYKLVDDEKVCCYFSYVR